jgi:tetratricopeptide (TPR) repeat protein
VVAGRTIEGRYITPEAYAAVMKAELLVAEGRLEQALGAYEFASEVASYSPAVWTRLGTLACQLERDDATEAFAKAEALDHDYEPLWRERARCALSQGNVQAALQAAQRAASLDPKRAESTVLVANALSRLGHHQKASAWRRAYDLRHSLTAPAQTVALAATPADPSSRLLDAPGGPHCSGGPEALDHALRRDDLFAARACAVALHLAPSELALHALEIGLPSAALQQAQLVLSANPLDGDARVAALCSSDLLRDEARFRSLLILPTGFSELSPLAARHLERLLIRRAQLSGEPGSAGVGNAPGNTTDSHHPH